MTDCSSTHGSTTSSSDMISSRGCTINPRIRIIRMVRPNSRRVLFGPDNNSSFGFAIRGGKEFSTGFFVSKIERGSEADIRGLRVGDQIIRANGYNVDDAIHKELTQYISSQDKLTLKVRGVGMLPVKEKTIDPLTWHIVPRHTLTTVTDLEETRLAQKDMRIILKVAPRAKLGLGICKGPEWKPGIFVQFTKEFSVARDAGLGPGDQILSCNSIDFSDVLFSEAVAVMKSSQILEMVVRTGAGLDLFPSESSGYNSSASSVTGDQSPCWGDHSSKRLSIVRKENSLDKLRMQSKYWYDRNSLYQKECLSINGSESNYATESNGNKMIIQLSESGTLINNTLVSNTNNEMTKNHQYVEETLPLTENTLSNRSYNDLSSTSSTISSLSTEENVNKKNITASEDFTSNSLINTNCSVNQDKADSSKVNGKISDICFVSRQSETKTVVVEVHRSAITEEANRSMSSSALLATGAPAPPPRLTLSSPFSPTSNDNIPKRSSSVISLSSAISEELKKRQERRFSNQNTNQEAIKNQVELRQQPPKQFGNSSLGGNDDEKRHSALMDEFKRAHRKMFKNGFQEDDIQERQVELNKINRIRKDGTQQSQNEISKTENSPQIPVPPPPPSQLTSSIGSQKLQVHFISSLLTPTPDYDSTSTCTIRRNGLSSTKHNNANQKKTNIIERLLSIEGDNADTDELESIESYKFQNSSSAIPEPPSLYFSLQNSGPPKMKKNNNNRNVAITIGEYGGQKIRKEPAKLDFVSKSEMNNNNSKNLQLNDNYKNDSVSEKLRHELEKTLSRSNLRKRSEFDINLQNQQKNNNTNNSGKTTTNGKSSTNLLKSPNIEKLANMLQSRYRLNSDNDILSNLNQNGNSLAEISNKITISVPSNKHQELRITESAPPMNGILKNCHTTKSNNFGEKSITFGN